MVLADHFTARSSANSTHMYKNHSEVGIRLRCPYRSTLRTRSRALGSMKKHTHEHPPLCSTTWRTYHGGELPKSEPSGIHLSHPDLHELSHADGSSHENLALGLHIVSKLQDLSLKEPSLEHAAQLDSDSRNALSHNDADDEDEPFPLIEWANDTPLYVRGHVPSLPIQNNRSQSFVSSTARTSSARRLKRCKSFGSDLCQLDAAAVGLLHPE